jgi:hypothetical protein
MITPGGFAGCRYADDGVDFFVPPRPWRHAALVCCRRVIQFAARLREGIITALLKQQAKMAMTV